MKVAELMQRTVKTVTDDVSVAEAIVTLADAHVSGLPVLDARGRVVGALTTTDVLEAEAENTDLAETLVRDIMTPRPLMIAPDEDVREAARQMLYAEVHRLFVELDGKLVGVISQSDLVRAVATSRV